MGSSNSFTVCPTSQKKLSAAHGSEYIGVPYSDEPFPLGVPAIRHISKAQIMNMQEMVKDIKTIDVKIFYTFNEATADQNENHISMNGTTMTDKAVQLLQCDLNKHSHKTQKQYATTLFITVEMYILYDDPSPIFHLHYTVLTSNFQFLEVKLKVQVFMYVS
jgi:hypothetical protein